VLVSEVIVCRDFEPTHSPDAMFLMSLSLIVIQWSEDRKVSFYCTVLGVLVILLLQSECHNHSLPCVLTVV